MKSLTEIGGKKTEEKSWNNEKERKKRGNEEKKMRMRIQFNSTLFYLSVKQNVQFMTWQNNLKGKSGPKLSSFHEKEKKKNFPTKWKNWTRNKVVINFWIFPYYRKTLLDQPSWIFNWVRWWCHTLTTYHISHIKVWKI